MANPYHDEAGRFASRDEMRGAIERLRDSGDVKAALALSLELSDIDAVRIKETESGSIEQFLAGDTDYATASAWVYEAEQRAGKLITWEQKADALQHDILSPDLRDKIISTLDFGDRYDLLENRPVKPEIAEALLKDQENYRVGRLFYNDLVWMATPSLGREGAKKYATRTPSISHQYLQTHGYLEGSAEFDRNLITWGHNAGQVGTFTEVARRSSDRETLTSLASESGLTSEGLNELAGNPHLGNQGAAAVTKRGITFIGGWDQSRKRLINNESVAQVIRERMQNPAKNAGPYVEISQNDLDTKITEGQAKLEAARELTLGFGMDGQLDTSAKYYAAREQQRDAYGEVSGLKAQRDARNLYDLHDKQAAERGTVQDRQLVNQRVHNAENYLTWRSDKRVIDELVLS